MTMKTARRALGWCTVINIAVYVVWFLIFALAHNWMYGFMGHWVHMSVDLFDAMNIAGIGLYKIGVILFNLSPYLALRIVGDS
jgi:hypothetical protein